MVIAPLLPRTLQCFIFRGFGLRTAAPEIGLRNKTSPGMLGETMAYLRPLACLSRPGSAGKAGFDARGFGMAAAGLVLLVWSPADYRLAVLSVLASGVSILELRRQVPWQNVAGIAAVLAGLPTTVAAVLFLVSADSVLRLFLFGAPVLSAAAFLVAGCWWFAVAATSRIAAKSLLSRGAHRVNHGYEVLALAGVLAFVTLFELHLLSPTPEGQFAWRHALAAGAVCAAIVLALLVIASPWFIRKGPATTKERGGWAWSFIATGILVLLLR